MAEHDRLHHFTGKEPNEKPQPTVWVVIKKVKILGDKQ